MLAALRSCWLLLSPQEVFKRQRCVETWGCAWLPRPPAMGQQPKPSSISRPCSCRLSAAPAACQMPHHQLLHHTAIISHTRQPHQHACSSRNQQQQLHSSSRAAFRTTCVVVKQARSVVWSSLRYSCHRTHMCAVCDFVLCFPLCATPIHNRLVALTCVFTSRTRVRPPLPCARWSCQRPRTTWRTCWHASAASPSTGG